VGQSASASPNQPLPPQGDLARLFETERRLEERLRAARAEGAALLAQAQQAAEQQDAALEAQLAEAARLLDESLAAEGQRRTAEIADAADREAQAYERVPPARLAAVARALAERFLLAEGAA
jgi:enamine deaminase RidA (YjgF/YER057c/UK114 family)